MGEISEEKSHWVETERRPGGAKMGADQLEEAEMTLGHLEKEMGNEILKK